MQLEAANKIVDSYEKLRDECYRLARENDGELMGKDAWLRFAISNDDIRMWPGSDGINCTGMTYTSQTMGLEDFDFTIPYDRIPL